MRKFDNQKGYYVLVDKSRVALFGDRYTDEPTEPKKTRVRKKKEDEVEEEKKEE